MNPTLTWDIARERHADEVALAARQRATAGTRRPHLRTALGLALVAAGTRLAETDEREPAVISLPRASC